jgi:hypothetical protein
MNSRRLTNIVKGAVVISCVVVFSFSASSVARANTRVKAPARASTMKRNPSEIKRTLLRIIDRKGKINPKLVKALSACGCSVEPQEQGGFGGFKACVWSCLESSGLSVASLTACAIVCSGGNWVGCAICLGVHEWVVLACTQYCAWRRVFNYTEASLRPSRKRGVQPTKRIPKPATVVT